MTGEWEEKSKKPTSSASAVGAITTATLGTRSNDRAVGVLRVIHADVAGTATAVGHFSSHFNVC